MVHKIEETIRMEILAYSASLFYHLSELKKIANDILDFNTTQAK